MAPIRYSLQYEDYSEHLMFRFGKLLQMQSLVDMTLMCSSHTLRVHRAVLAASSAYFQEVLQKQTGEPLIILKMRFSVLKSLVEFMYCGKTQCLEENLDELVSAAQFLKIKGLSKVTKEGLGITNQTELPIFTPPVVINRPPQSLINLHTQDSNAPGQPAQQPPTSASQSLDNMRANKDTVVHIPFDVENGGITKPGMDYDNLRAIRPRRGRPAIRGPRAGDWDGGTLGRAAERALLRREQDSRKAIHQLKNLQSRHMQDYMDRVSLSEAVSSICDPETSSSSQNYMNMDNDLMYMVPPTSSNILDPTVSFSKTLENDTVTANYSTTTTSTTETVTSGIGSAMSQYINVLKNAGLPTDLPILFESGDGSYVNVNEQVLLDMVQSSEIQYEVIEQPNIIDKVADPSEIKSIDELSQSIERGELLVGSENINNDFNKDITRDDPHAEVINGLNAILPDNLESFSEQQNYVVLDHSLEHNNPLESTTDFSCMETDMQFFTKSMSDDVKKYYEEPHLCPVSASLDTNFHMSLLDTKLNNDNITQDFNSLNPEELRRSEDCYDFSLPLSQPTGFKDDELDCMISKENDEIKDYIGSDKIEENVQESDEIIKDLMNIESDINKTNIMEMNKENMDSQVNFDMNSVFQGEEINKKSNEEVKSSTEYAPRIISDNTWDMECGHENDQEKYVPVNDKSCNRNEENNVEKPECEISQSVIDLSSSMNIKPENWGDMDVDSHRSITPQLNEDISKTLEEDIPFAVGLLPSKQIQPPEEDSETKRKHTFDADIFNDIDVKCLKRKKYKKM